MVDNERLKLGVFAIVAIVILFLSLFLVGLRDVLEPKLLMATIFEESIQGIDVGSPVKFRGVPVGKVCAISIRPYGQGIRVDMDVNLTMFDPVVEHVVDESKRIIPFSREYFSRQVEKGLRAQLEMASVMGTKYVEIDYFDTDRELSPFEEKLANGFQKDDYFFIPSKRSLLSDLKTSFADIMVTAQKTLNNINTIDFEELNKTVYEVKTTFVDVQRQLDEKGKKLDLIISNAILVSDRINHWGEAINIQEIRETIKQIHEISSTSKSLVDEVRSELKEMKLVSAVDETRKMMIQIQEEVKKANISKQLELFNQRFERIADDANTATISIVQLSDEARIIFNSVNPVLVHFVELLSTIEQNPSEILYGPRNINVIKNAGQTQDSARF